MSRILISYRRDDSADVIGRIYGRLVQQFGRATVLKEVESILFGADFRKYLDEQVAMIHPLHLELETAPVALDDKGHERRLTFLSQ